MQLIVRIIYIQLFIIQFINDMISIVVIVIQLIAIIFIGAFARTTDSTIVNATYLSSSLALLLGFALMQISYKRFSLTILTAMLLASALGIEAYILFGTFWNSCFTGFATFFTLTTSFLIRSVFCSLSILLTFLDFNGLIRYWQIYFLLVPIMTIGYALNSAVLVYGINVYDGGGGLQIFLYSGVISLVIWALVIRGNTTNQVYKINQSYFNRTLSFIGVVIVFISWPQFNLVGAQVTRLNTILDSTDSTLASSALANTILSLSMSILTAFLLSSSGDDTKLNPKTYIHCFINSGIVVASYTDVLQDPAASMTLSFVSTVLTLIFFKYIASQSYTSDASEAKKLTSHFAGIIFKIFFSFLGIIICSIVVATRSGKTPAILADTYSQKAGLQIAGFFITLLISFVFGLISAGCIIAYMKYRGQPDKKQIIDDLHFFNELNDQMFPIYCDKKHSLLVEEQKANLMLKQSLMRQQQHSTKPQKQPQTTKNENIKITLNYAKQNAKKGDTNVSKMKDPPSTIKFQDYEKDSYQSRKKQELLNNQKIKIHQQTSVVRKSRMQNEQQINISKKLEYGTMQKK